MLAQGISGWRSVSLAGRFVLVSPERKALALFVFSLVILFKTLSPTLYLLDSPEFAIGAAQLGIVHAPGYPLYLLIAHLFTRLPVGDIAFRVNLLSAVALALSPPFIFLMLLDLIQEQWIALSTTLILGFSFYVWSSGVAAEVYAPQLLTCAITGYTITRLCLHSHDRERWALRAGAAFGVAVAMHPSSALLSPGIVMAFLTVPISWRRRLVAAAISGVIVAVCLLYFPLRFGASPTLNLAGHYDASGVFQPVPLNRIEGIWWMLRGAQFSHLFWSRGLPSPAQLGSILLLFWNNFLGVGFLLGILGLGVMSRHPRRLAVWSGFFLPYTYFYLLYNVPDRDFMLGPSLLLWSIALAFGLRWCLEGIGRPVRMAIALILPAVVFSANFSLLNLSGDTSVRVRAERTLQMLPEGAYVFGDWLEIVPVQYLSMVEQQRPDLRVYNLFLFDQLALNQYIGHILLTSDHPVIFMREPEASSLNLDLLDTSLYRMMPIEIGGADPPAFVYLITRRSR
jgi:hypothetical protein